MSKHTAMWIPLSQCVNMYIDESAQDITKFRRLWVMAFRCMEQFNMDIYGRPKSKILRVQPNKTVELPDDYISYTKVGMPNANGEIVTMKINNNLTSIDYDGDNRLGLIDSHSDNTYRDSYDYTNPSHYTNFYHDGSYINLFGLPSGLTDVGECKVDDEAGVIILEPSFTGSCIVLEYIYSPEMDDEYKIPVQCREAVIAWLRWKDSISKAASRRTVLGDKRDARFEFYNERRLARKRLSVFRLSEANIQSRETSKLVVKG